MSEKKGGSLTVCQVNPGMFDNCCLSSMVLKKVEGGSKFHLPCGNNSNTIV